MDPMTLLAGALPGTPGVDGYFPVLSLATVDAAGLPDVRTVLLSEIVGEELYFHTDTGSRKVVQLETTPVAALLVTLPEQARQIVARGPVRRVTDEEAARAYHVRSRYLQLLAWTNTVASAQLPAAERESRWAEFAEAHPDGTLTPPAGWCGFAVRPDRMTFWQGGPDGPSHRVEYTRDGNSWTDAHLPG
jgi:pyridoxamine 5'-phosphate oxidase